MANADELERDLRAAISDAGAAWLLQQIDLAVSEGHPVARKKQGGEITLAGAFDAKDVEITSAPFTAEERVELIIAAVRRVFVAAPRLVAEAERLLLGDEADVLRFSSPSRGEDLRSSPARADVFEAQEAASEIEATMTRVEEELAS